MSRQQKNSRYSGLPIRLYDLMKLFVVHCPKCNGVANITVPDLLDFKNAQLNCSACYFSEKAKERIRFKTNSKAKCRECLSPLDGVDNRKRISKVVNIRCKECKSENKISENWESYILKYHETGTIDPAFGLPLFYQELVKGHILWAFNGSHLNEIKNYVASSLRERTTDKFKMTMVEKLPNFIKVAKNREEVLRALTKMEHKFENLNSQNKRL